MSQFSPLHGENLQRLGRLLQILFTLLAVAFLLLASIELGLTWLGDANGGNLFSISLATARNSEGKYLTTFFLSLLTVLVVWLLSTITLLLARQWTAAVLAVPLALIALISVCLFIAMVIPYIPSVLFIALLLPLNGSAFWLARYFLVSTSSRVRPPSPPR